VPVRETSAKSILIKQKRIDSWFVSRYGMNLYRGCAHDCIYCDGRAEKYRVEGSFSEDVVVKTNAVEILKRELDPRRKRKPFKKAYIFVGGGIGDSYQPAETEYRLTRRVLDLLSQHSFPLHLLTKSALIERDLDLLTRVGEKNRVIISFSFSTADDRKAAFLEPGASPPSERLRVIEKVRTAGLHSGVYMMPVVPCISDDEKTMEETLRAITNAGAEFVVFGGMTLKEGRQQEYFLRKITDGMPEYTPFTEELSGTEAAEKIRLLYPGNRWGGARSDYYRTIEERFGVLAKKAGLPRRLPPFLYADILDDNDLVTVMLDQLDYCAKLENRNAPYGYAARSVSYLQESIKEVRRRSGLRGLSGVGPATERLICEILDTRRCRYLEELL
jgi:DNA repair photolyase